MRTLLCIFSTQEHFCGISALGYAAYNGYKDITLVGFGALDPDIDSVVMFMKYRIYKTKYNKDDTVNYIQKMQFVSLLKTSCLKG